MNPTLRRYALPLLSAVLTWGALAAAVYGLAGSPDHEPSTWLMVAFAPSAALLCARLTVLNLSHCGRAARVLFLIPTLLVILLALLLLEGKCERPSQNLTSFLLLFATGPCLIGLGMLLLAFRKKNRAPAEAAPSKPGWFGDAAIAMAILVTVASAGWAWFSHSAAQLEAKGLKRWAEIGRPMPEFAKNQKPIEENASLLALLRDLRPYGVRSLYRPGIITISKHPQNDVAAAERTEFGSPDVLELMGTKQLPGDAVVLPADKSRPLMARGQELAELYRGILSQPAPVWTYHPKDGLTAARPDFLLLRQMAQTMQVDALLRLSQGDREEAAAALAAGLRVSESLRENPIMVSPMIRVAIEALFVPVTARLPEQPDAWARLKKDADLMRAGLKNCLQTDALNLMELATECDQPTYGPLPRWLDKRLTRLIFQNEVGRLSMVAAGTIDYWNREDLLASTDFGDAFVVQTLAKYPAWSGPNFARAWARLNMTLLLREQAEMICFARARMDAGQLPPQSERASVVVPGAKWEIKADFAARTVAMKLTPHIPWTIDSIVTEKNFLLPLDGSKFWQFAKP